MSANNQYLVMESVNQSDERRYFTDWYAISMARILVIGTGLERF
jgi:hypothetical protein